MFVRVANITREEVLVLLLPLGYCIVLILIYDFVGYVFFFFLFI